MENTSVALVTKYELDKNFDSEKFIKLRIKVCHDGENYNYSALTVDSMQKAAESCKNIPILAHVVFDDDGKPQFGGHDMYLDNDVTGEEYCRWVYEEIPIGVVPETNNYEIKEAEGKQYVFVDAYVWRDYSNLAEYIIERDQEIKVSMEIKVDKYEVAKDSDVMTIIDYRYLGITFLGNDLQTGMKNTKATVLDYSQSEECKFDFIKNELSKELEKSEEKVEVFMQKDETKAVEEMVTKEIFEEEMPEEEKPEEEKPEEVKPEEEEPEEEIEEEEEKGEPEEEEVDEDSEEAEEEVDDEKDEDEEVIVEETAKNEMQERLEALEKEFKEYKESHLYKNAEVEKLKEFKSKTEANEIFAEFEDLLGIEEFEALKENGYKKYSLEELEEKCFAIRGKNSVAKEEMELTGVGFALKHKDAKESKILYGGIFEKYGK